MCCDEVLIWKANNKAVSKLLLASTRSSPLCGNEFLVAKEKEVASVDWSSFMVISRLNPHDD